MGFPMPGEVLSWEDTKKYAEHVRQHGIIQLINWYKRVKDRKGDDHKWGDEIEYLIVKFLEEKGEAKCSIRSAEILDSLDSKKNSDPATNKAIWLPECGAYMIEATPLEPYNSELSELNRVEKHLIERRKELSDILNHDELPVTVTIFPRLGAKNFTFPPAEPTPDKGAAQSLFFPDDAIYQVHGRYLAATQNIRGRRGENPPANVPIYMDKNTKIPVDDSYLRRQNASPDHVYLDTLCFGMGFCCLQITFQTFDLTEARVLYDQLGPITPIMLALTAASPMIRGFLTDVDCRWGILAAGGDCRTEEERGLKPLAEGKVVIPKPRCCSIRSYLTPEGDKYNDLPLVYFEENYRKLVDNGIDHLLAAHFAFLFIRDTISLTSGTINQNDEEDTGHFEIHQTMNWPSLRFKLPLPKANCGWRVELRPCESQLTDFENAAVTCFAVLLTRVIFAKKTNFLIPISKIDENMDNAQKRNAAREQKFWFRRDITTPVNETTNDVYVQLTLNEVINGKEGEFIGLIPVIENHLSNEEIDKETRATIQKYLKFVSRRASGEILTTASWLRKFVTEHPDYRSDSIVSEQINYDLMKTITDIQSGKKYCPLLLGPRSEN